MISLEDEEASDEDLLLDFDIRVRFRVFLVMMSQVKLKNSE